jgi:methionine aminopeptidase
MSKTATASAATKPADYTLANPDTLTKYKVAGEISTKVLEQVKQLLVPDARIIDICIKGDELLIEVG